MKPSAFQGAKFGGFAAQTDSVPVSQEEPVTPKDNVMDTVMSLQSSSGVFRWDDALVAMLGGDRAQLAAKFAASGVEGAADEAVWVTVAVLSFLQRECAEKKDLWELMAQKATKWLKKRIGEEGLEKMKKIV